jgi:putative tricarboxylic transport membrane protein
VQPKQPADVGAAVVAAILALVALAALWGARNFSSMGSWFPNTISVILLGASLLAAWRSLRGRGRKDRSMARDGALRSGLLIVVLLAWILLLETTGFVVTSIAAFLVLALVANRDPLTPKRIAGYVIASAVIVLAFHFLFVDILKVQLPRGTLGWW